MFVQSILGWVKNKLFSIEHTVSTPFHLPPILKHGPRLRVKQPSFREKAAILRGLWQGSLFDVTFTRDYAEFTCLKPVEYIRIDFIIQDGEARILNPVEEEEEVQCP